MKARNTRSLAVGSALALLVAGCATTQSSTGTSATTGASAVGSEGAFEVIAVSSTATECAVSTRTTRSGTATFSVRNSGPQITEFYLLGPDGLRIVAEKENIAPGGSADLTVTLQPGSYFTACKPGMRGANVGEAAFSVTGERVEVPAEDKQLFDQAVRDYVNFVKNEVAELQPKVEGFVAAYVAGDDEQARRSYAAARVHYERIEPIAEALGLLDPRIDYREIDYLAEAEALAKDDPTFTEWLGFHRMEKDLWVPAKDAVQPDGANAWEGWTPSTPEVRARIGSALKADVGALYDKVHAADFVTAQELDIAAVANGASALLEEIAVGKVTGEEDWWSHTDLWDFQANLQGSRIAFDLVAPIATRKGPDATALAASISREFDALQALLSTYGNLTDGFVLYNTVSRDQQRALAAQIDAVREPLSKITNTVLGAAG
ncbi:MAG: peptidase M75 family protein [Actinomycetales bacterium]|nr:peptidase M75 family protein [Actinomycetales bacterium]